MQMSNKHTALEDPTHAVERTSRGLSSTFSALHHRNFRLFWSGQLVSLIGTWMQTTGQAWLVLQLTHNAWLLGVVGALQFLPVMFFSLFGGVIADRVPKRTVLLFTQSFAAIQAFILWGLVFSGTVQLWHIFVLALLLGCTNALDMPTRQAFVTEMVGRQDLPNAIALNSSVFNMARIIGPGIGGLIIARFDVGPLFLLNAMSFIPVIISLSMIDDRQLHAQVKRALDSDSAHGPLQSIREGLGYVAHTPTVLLIIAVVGVVSLFGINFNVALPLFADNVLNVGASGFGFISAAFGIGSLLSALWLAWRNQKPSIARMLICGLLFGVFEILFAISHIYLLSLLFIAAVGFAQIAFTATANTTLQMITPNYLRGRVMSVYMLVFTGTNPIGNLLVGGLSDSIGASLAFLICAILSLIAAVTGWFLRAPAEKGMTEFKRVEE